MKDRYLTVTALTRYIKHKIETDRNLKEVYLRGEISNFKHHSRGHMYLTLKDDYARIQAVMFSSHNRYLKFTPENGMNVLIKGEISIYEPHGQYQLYIHDMQPDGIGALYLAYEQLKEKLEKEGLFSEDRKKEIPSFPEHIGIITSPTGAAIRDIFTTINRRYPIVKKTLIPVSVQGEYAAPSIVQAIQKANELNIFDVLIVGRGGGSIEELWSFNEEIVARAIANSDIPIISAVGHETDFTISDFVADLRAPTPTAAAEMAVPSLIELQEKALLLTKRLNRSMVLHIANHREKLKTLTESYAFRSPVQLLRQKEIDLDRLQDQLQKMSLLYVTRKKDSLQFLYRQLSNQHPKRKMEQVHNTVEQLTKQMNRGMQSYLKEKQHLLYHKIEKLSLLNPLETMKRGFTITYNEKNDVVKSVNQVQPGEKINVKLLDGTLDCQVWGIEEEETKNG